MRYDTFRSGRRSNDSLIIRVTNRAGDSFFVSASRLGVVGLITLVICAGLVRYLFF
jgi:hypothetical protein